MRDEAKQWVADGKKISISRFVDNVRAGKSFDGTRQIKELYDFNARTIARDVIQRRYDFASEQEILRRGHITYDIRGTKLLLFIGALGVAAKIGNAVAQANDISTVLTEGEGIRDALKFARLGKDVSFERALIGVGNARESTFEELLKINPVFAIAFRKTVELGIQGLRE